MGPHSPAVRRYHDETDEFVRIRVAHSLLWAIGLAFGLCTCLVALRYG